MKSLEIEYTKHCENESCELGTATYTCIKCKEEQVDYEQLWFDRGINKQISLKCKSCGNEVELKYLSYGKYLVMLSQTEMRRRRVESDKIIKEWSNQHKHCPNCKSTTLTQTLAGVVYIEGQPYEDNVNDANCLNCNWHGKVKELV